MRQIILCVLMLLLCACRLQRHIPQTPAVMIMERNDSLRVVHRELIHIDTITAMLEVPKQSVMQVGPDSSHLETDFAISDAWLTPDGLQHHILRNKEQHRPIEVPVPTRSISTDSVRERRIEVPMPYPVQVTVERNFSTWEHVRLKGFVPAVIVALVCLGFIFKRIARQ